MNIPTFKFYLVARACMSLASTILTVTIGWHLYQLTGDPFDLALVGLVQITPILLLFILSGWVVDNFSRKKVLVMCALVQTLIFLLLALVMQVEDFDKTAVFVLLFFHGCIRAFFSPAQEATLPNIVPRAKLAKAVAITAIVWNVTSTSGPFAAGLLLAWIDRDTYWVLSGLSLSGGLLFATLPVLQQKKASGRGWAQILGGIAFTKRNPIVLGCISLDLFSILLGSVMALLPIYAIDILNVGPEALGLLRGMPALGAVMVGLAMTRLPLRRPGTSLFTALVIFSLSILMFAFSTNIWLSLIALWIYGATDMVSVNIRSTLVQMATPDDLRGRVSAVNSIFIATSNEMGDFRAGAVATILPVTTTVALGGLMALGVVIGGYFMFPSIRKLRSLSEIEPEKS